MAASLARGEFVNLLHDDDWLEPGFAARTARAVTDRIAYAFTQARIVHDDGREAFNIPQSVTGAIIGAGRFESTLLSMQFCISPCCVMFRRRDLLRDIIVGKLPISDPPEIGHDLLITLLPLMRYSAVAYISDPLVNFRAHDSSCTIRELNADGGKNLQRQYDLARLYYSAIRKWIANETP
jgi:hypothetical protein